MEWNQAFSIIPKKYIPVIIGAAAAAIASTVVAYAYVAGGIIDLPRQQDIGDSSVLGTLQQNTQAQTYRINTQCEMVLAMVKGQYPNGEQIPKLEMSYLLTKYPDEFKQWKDILEDPEKRKSFVTDASHDEFNQVLVPVMMKEFLINPDLKPTAMLITDPQGKLELKQVYDENGCQEFFDKRQNSTSP